MLLRASVSKKGFCNYLVVHFSLRNSAKNVYLRWVITYHVTCYLDFGEESNRKRSSNIESEYKRKTKSLLIRKRFSWGQLICPRMSRNTYLKYFIAVTKQRQGLNRTKHKYKENRSKDRKIIKTSFIVAQHSNKKNIKNINRQQKNNY